MLDRITRYRLERLDGPPPVYGIYDDKKLGHSEFAAMIAFRLQAWSVFVLQRLRI
jgi:hypothetical protein